MIVRTELHSSCRKWESLGPIFRNSGRDVEYSMCLTAGDCRQQTEVGKAEVFRGNSKGGREVSRIDALAVSKNNL